LCCIAVAVRSPMASRSHWLTEARTLSTSRPAALRVSICSLAERTSAAYAGWNCQTAGCDSWGSCIGSSCVPADPTEVGSCNAAGCITAQRVELLVPYLERPKREYRLLGLIPIYHDFALGIIYATSLGGGHTLLQVAFNASGGTRDMITTIGPGYGRSVFPQLCSLDSLCTTCSFGDEYGAFLPEPLL
jgi:hypothetical protein